MSCDYRDRGRKASRAITELWMSESDGVASRFLSPMDLILAAWVGSLLGYCRFNRVQWDMVGQGSKNDQGYGQGAVVGRAIPGRRPQNTRRDPVAFDLAGPLRVPEVFGEERLHLGHGVSRGFGIVFQIVA